MKKILLLIFLFIPCFCFANEKRQDAIYSRSMEKLHKLMTITRDRGILEGEIVENIDKFKEGLKNPKNRDWLYDKLKSKGSNLKRDVYDNIFVGLYPEETTAEASQSTTSSISVSLMPSKDLYYLTIRKSDFFFVSLCFAFIIGLVVLYKLVKKLYKFKLIRKHFEKRKKLSIEYVSKINEKIDRSWNVIDKFFHFACKVGLIGLVFMLIVMLFIKGW